MRHAKITLLAEARVESQRSAVSMLDARASCATRSSNLRKPVAIPPKLSCTRSNTLHAEARKLRKGWSLAIYTKRLTRDLRRARRDAE